MTESKAFTNGATIHNNVALGKKPPSANTPYASPADKRDEQASKLSEVRDKFAPNADKPTTASGEVGLKDLLSLISKVDPNSISSILPSMFSAIKSSQKVLNSTDNEQKIGIISNALYFYIGEELNKNNTLLISYLDITSPDLWSTSFTERNATIFNRALSFLFQYKDKYPNTLYETYTPPIVVYGEKTPTFVIEAPEFYERQFFATEADPYLGYIQWKYNEDVVYTKRTLVDYPFESLDDYAFYTALYNIQTKVNSALLLLDFVDEKLDLILTEVFDIISDLYDSEVFGTNDSSKILQQLLGQIGQSLIKSAVKMGTSVLQQESMKKTSDKYSKNMTRLKKMKEQHKNVYKNKEDYPSTTPSELGVMKQGINWGPNT